MTCPKNLKRHSLSLPAGETGMAWGDRKEVSVVMPQPSKVELQDLCPSTSNATLQDSPSMVSSGWSYLKALGLQLSLLGGVGRPQKRKLRGVGA